MILHTACMAFCLSGSWWSLSTLIVTGLLTKVMLKLLFILLSWVSQILCFLYMLSCFFILYKLIYVLSRHSYNSWHACLVYNMYIVCSCSMLRLIATFVRWNYVYVMWVALFRVSFCNAHSLWSMVLHNKLLLASSMCNFMVIAQTIHNTLASIVQST